MMPLLWTYFCLILSIQSSMSTPLISSFVLTITFFRGAREVVALVAEVHSSLRDTFPDGAVWPPGPSAPEAAALAGLVLGGEPPQPPLELLEVACALGLGDEAEGLVVIDVDYEVPRLLYDVPPVVGAGGAVVPAAAGDLFVFSFQHQSIPNRQ